MSIGDDPYTGEYLYLFDKLRPDWATPSAVSTYPLLDADGTKRTVDYSADDVNGFNAVVRKDAVAPAQ